MDKSAGHALVCLCLVFDCMPAVLVFIANMFGFYVCNLVHYRELDRQSVVF